MASLPPKKDVMNAAKVIFFLLLALFLNPIHSGCGQSKPKASPPHPNPITQNPPKVDTETEESGSESEPETIADTTEPKAYSCETPLSSSDEEDKKRPQRRHNTPIKLLLEAEESTPRDTDAESCEASTKATTDDIKLEINSDDETQSKGKLRRSVNRRRARKATNSLDVALEDFIAHVQRFIEIPTNRTCQIMLAHFKALEDLYHKDTAFKALKSDPILKSSHYQSQKAHIKREIDAFGLLFKASTISDKDQASIDAYEYYLKTYPPSGGDSPRTTREKRTIEEELKRLHTAQLNKRASILAKHFQKPFNKESANDFERCRQDYKTASKKFSLVHDTMFALFEKCGVKPLFKDEACTKPYQRKNIRECEGKLSSEDMIILETCLADYEKYFLDRQYYEGAFILALTDWTAFHTSKDPLAQARGIVAGFVHEETSTLDPIHAPN